MIGKLKEEEENGSNTPEDKRIQKILKLQHEIKIKQTEEIEKKLKEVKQYLFENANKPGRLLAYKLKRTTKESNYGIEEQ